MSFADATQSHLAWVRDRSLDASSLATAARRVGARRLGRSERRSLLGMATVILVLHLVGWGLLVGVVAPQQYQVGGQLFGVGLGVTAYTLGMRHAFDADHIAAIDNTTRKLMAEGQRPMSVGFWFSLGHSSVVFVMVALRRPRHPGAGRRDRGRQLDAAAGHRRLGHRGLRRLPRRSSASSTSPRSSASSRSSARCARGHYDEAELERQLDKRGFLNRILGRVTRTVRKPWHMYPVGLLFGLGFDTVTEVGLLVIAGGAAAANLPWYAVLTLPVLFAAGMSLLDTIDGSFMNFAYGWAFAKPVRKIYYNITVTSLSVAVALVIGVIELVGLLGDKLDITSGPVAWIGSIDLADVGYWIVGLFVVTWVVALAVWRFGRIEERWSAALPDGGA